MNAQNRLDRAAVYLSLIQFLFATCWIVYVHYLGDLLDRVGISRDLLIWFILLDQVVFAFSDTAMGYAADRIERLVGRLGPSIMVVNAFSCIAFVLLPLVPELAGADGSPALFTLLLVIWIATSSALRAPPLVLLTKHAARPEAPRLAALTLLGLALASALAPYLAILLKGTGPLLPFMLTAATLVLATLGLSHIEQRIREQPRPQQTPSFTPISIPRLALFLLAALWIALGTQVHANLNSSPLYLRFVGSEQLPLLLPLFWVGFQLLALPGTSAAKRLGTLPVMSFSALAGAIALYLASQASSLPLLIAAQLLAGGAWGIALSTGIGTAVNLGTSGREGLTLGMLFSVLSLATLARAGFVASGLTTSPEIAELQRWAPGMLWLIGGLVLLPMTVLAKRRPPSPAPSG